MNNLKDLLVKISPVLWEIPQAYRKDMRVPARIFATKKMLEEEFNDSSLEQLINVATLPGILQAALAMPDAHEGYGFPIGGVAAMDIDTGVISPGGIGYDINCGVRLLSSEMNVRDGEKEFESLAREIFHQVPSGVGRGGQLKLKTTDLDKVLATGVQWMLENEYALPDDIGRIESHGTMTNADPNQVTDHAKKRGLDQLGTLGAGNHFAEVDVVADIYDEQAAQAMGLRKDQLVVMIHTGSRGLGHQVATDFIREMMKVMPDYGITIPDRELACVPFASDEGQRYFNAMAAAANFAWSNRQMITWEIRQAWKRVYGESGGKLKLVYDVAHNMAKKEVHDINGKQQEVIVHRKGATRAFPPGHDELIEDYKNIGQPVFIPGSMGTSSYVLAGTQQGMKDSFGSSCHGAGRRLSRKAAKKEIQGKVLRDELRKRGIIITTGSVPGLAEEAPLAYKDVDEVVDVVHQAGIAKKVARLEPRVVIKG